MKTIKLKDLIIKIANEEKLPKRIKFHNMIWELDKHQYNELCHDYYTENRDSYLFYNKWYLTNNLNDEVEIIEEEKVEEPRQIERIDQTLNRIDMGDDYYRYIMETRFKLNEVIDAVNEWLEKEK